VRSIKLTISSVFERLLIYRIVSYCIVMHRVPTLSSVYLRELPASVHRRYLRCSKVPPFGNLSMYTSATPNLCMQGEYSVQKGEIWGVL